MQALAEASPACGSPDHPQSLGVWTYGLADNARPAAWDMLLDVMGKSWGSKDPGCCATMAKLILYRDHQDWLVV